MKPIREAFLSFVALSLLPGLWLGLLWNAGRERDDAAQWRRQATIEAAYHEADARRIAALEDSLVQMKRLHDGRIGDIWAAVKRHEEEED